MVDLKSSKPCYMCGRQTVILFFDKEGIKAKCTNCGCEDVEWEITNGIEQLRVVAHIHGVKVEDLYKKIDEANSKGYRNP